MPRARLFGTDGIRGEFGRYPLDGPTVTELGRRLARRLGENHAAGARAPPPLVILGGDTRDSTPTLCGWLAQGLEEGGAQFRYVGVIPTPGVAHLVRHWGASCGIGVSASHNLHPDNGIKLITGEGFKWPPEAEAELEERLRAGQTESPETGAAELAVDPGGAELYRQALVSALPRARALGDLRISLDTANGAATPFARSVFEGLGARVSVIHERPDGRNINQGCGSTHPQELAALTRSTGSDLGLAFDGDADRVTLTDETGQVWDGDAILYLWAKNLKAQGELQPPKIVATTMSNLGLERALNPEGIEVVRCEVGDRAVVETMRREGILLGGEQSGHIVHLGLSTTGDGLLTGLAIAQVRSSSGWTLSRLLRGFHRLPQVLRNVAVREKRDLETLPGLRATVASVRERLGEEGRLVLRYSGTEPVARIMIEGEDPAFIDALAEEIAEEITQHLGTG